MNKLQRNKEIILARRAGTKIVDLAKKYGVSATNLSKAYYDFEFLVDRPFYDVVAGMGFSDQAGTKLVNLLHKYEITHHVDLTPEMIRDIPRWEFHSLRGAGVSTMVAFDKLQEALR